MGSSATPELKISSYFPPTDGPSSNDGRTRGLMSSRRLSADTTSSATGERSYAHLRSVSTMPSVSVPFTDEASTEAKEAKRAAEARRRVPPTLADSCGQRRSLLPVLCAEESFVRLLGDN
eukprot:CAMPEP_0113558842 /NCGR_PEP_ID=MMETSP0015_2-20120614/18574_1 /TAXON_ID=2838 /ORGANISM="Odontella" /LENGTH=119 /DNA_ID=CAMNT_0000460429 /DNA_START=279 /DNA_END=638 /DNA_ORIENTATION=+ /assembly_acc=CAM_ASM_000160